MAKVYVLVFDGYADWEPALALAELRRSGGLDVVTLGFTGEPVRSMGGLRVLPDRRLADLRTDDARLLLLPGGDLWEADYPRPAVEDALHAVRQARVPVAGICAATVALARAGLLDDRAHTSNGRDYLRQLVPGYRGAERYVESLAARDGGVITASGAGPTEFAREILAELDVLTPEDRAVWFDIFKHGRLPEPAASDARSARGVE
jgi:putative intracellular protease/amidase